MEAEGLIKLIHEVKRNSADRGTNAFDCDRADLFGLCLGIDGKPRLISRKQRLERVHVIDVGRDRDDRHHAPSKLLSCGVGSVIADDHTWSRVCSFASDDRVKIDEPDLTAMHQASAVAASQALLLGSSAHSENAAA